MKRGSGSFNKLGQYYLVAAIIIAAIVISIIAISNYSKKNESKDINSLKDEIKIESASVLDYGINNKLNQQGMNTLLQNFTQRYIDTESRDKNLYFVFGNQNNMTLKGYQNIEHTVSFEGVFASSSSGSFLKSVDPAANSATLQIDENAYIFSLKTGENFFFVISQEIGGDEYVVTG